VVATHIPINPHTSEVIAPSKNAIMVKNLYLSIKAIMIENTIRKIAIEKYSNFKKVIAP